MKLFKWEPGGLANAEGLSAHYSPVWRKMLLVKYVSVFLTSSASDIVWNGDDPVDPTLMKNYSSLLLDG